MGNDICIIGLGRVGLPLALSLEEQGFSVTGVDVNPEVNKAIQDGKMPFYEPGYDELIKNSNIEVHTPDNYPEADSYIITVGTPLEQHLETDLTTVVSVVKSIRDQVDLNNKTIILRSTVAPYTTEFIKNYIEMYTGHIVGEDVFLTMCPERIVEGKAYEELKILPQIVGAADDESYKRAENIFSKLGVDIYRATYVEAELSKLFTNIYRYINFAIPNYFTYVANQFGVDVFKLFKTMNSGYDRNNGLKLPGFAAGTCLRKDFGMINEHFPQTDMILQAYKVNEFMPKFYVDLLGSELKDKNVGILGYTMKKDTDDTRDSLIPKMVRYIRRNVPKNVYFSDSNLEYGKVEDTYNDHEFINEEFEDVVNKSDVVFISMNHSEYSNNKEKLEKLFEKNNTIVIDIWGILGKEIINYY